MEPEPELQPEPASHQLQPQPGGQQQLTREYAVAVVERYGAAWASQDEEAITRIFSEDAQYLEHPFDPRRIYEGRAGIRDYWVRQIQGKQKDIRFTQVPEALLLDSEKRTALAKWEATFSNLQRDGKTYAPVSFVQVAMLSFDERGLITKLEEYWTARGKHGKGDGRPAAGALRQPPLPPAQQPPESQHGEPPPQQPLSQDRASSSTVVLAASVGTEHGTPRLLAFASKQFSDALQSAAEAKRAIRRGELSLNGIVVRSRGGERLALGDELILTHYPEAAAAERMRR